MAKANSKDELRCCFDHNGKTLTLVYKDCVKIYGIAELDIEICKEIKIVDVFFANCIKVNQCLFAMLLQKTEEKKDPGGSCLKIFKISKTEDAELVYTKKFDSTVNNLKHDSDGNIYAFCTSYVEKYNHGDWKLLRKIEIPSNPSAVCAVSRNNGFIAVPLFDDERRISLCDTKISSKLQSSFESGIKCEIQMIEFDQIGERLAVVNSNGTIIYIFHMIDKSKAVLFSLVRGMASAYIRSLHFTDDSKRLVVSSNRPTVHIFDVNEPESESSLAMTMNKYLETISTKLNVEDLLTMVRGKRAIQKVPIVEGNPDNLLCVAIGSETDFRLLVYCSGVFGVYFLKSPGKIHTSILKYLADPETEEFVEIDWNELKTSPKGNDKNT